MAIEFHIDGIDLPLKIDDRLSSATSLATEAADTGGHLMLLAALDGEEWKLKVVVEGDKGQQFHHPTGLHVAEVKPPDGDG